MREAPKVARLMLKTRQVHFLIEPNVGLLTPCKANLLPVGCGEEKQCLLQGTPWRAEQGEQAGQLVGQRPELLNGFQGNILKGKVRRGLQGA